MKAGDFIQTYTGGHFWPLAPSREDLHIEDIAHALSMICRYNGHCMEFYSVAEHCVLLSHAVSKENALWALLHDASEAYISDVPRPIKPMLSEYKVIEKAIMEHVCVKFGLPFEMPAEVHEMDMRICLDEREQNMMQTDVEWNIKGGPLGVNLKCWFPRRAEYEFLARFRELTKG